MIDLSKPLQTRDGRPVRIDYPDSGDITYPVHGAIQDPSSGSWRPDSWTKDGANNILIPCPNRDLVNAPEKHTITVYFWKHSSGCITQSCIPVPHGTVDFVPFAKKEVEVVEGEGL